MYRSSIKKSTRTCKLHTRLNNLVEESKTNNKFRNDYLAMNLHDRDIRPVAFAEGAGFSLEKNERIRKCVDEIHK